MNTEIKTHARKTKILKLSQDNVEYNFHLKPLQKKGNQKKRKTKQKLYLTSFGTFQMIFQWCQNKL